jgi:small subunit ribosomal protein S2
VALAVKELIDAGVHYGHRASRWNPKMKPYIYGKRNLIHIIDLKETVRGLLRAVKFFNRVAAGGGLILFVGTKRQAVDIITQEAGRCGMPYVTERWLGGTLTNFQTIRSRLNRLEELEGIFESEQALTYSKKMQASLKRERNKIQRNLEGIRHMTRRPEAMLVVDPHREKIAVSEARKLGVKVVALMDTDCDPDLVDLPIPGNDDSMRSIDLILRRLTDAIVDGKASAPPEPPPRPDDSFQQNFSGPRRSGDRRGGGGGGDRRGGGGGGRGYEPRPSAPPQAEAIAPAPGAPATAPSAVEASAVASEEPTPSAVSVAESPVVESLASEAPVAEASAPEAPAVEPAKPPAEDAQS